DSVSVAEIKEQFLSAIQTFKKLSPDISGHWAGTINEKRYLEDFGRKIRETSPVALSGSDLEIGFNNLTYDFDKITELLRQPASCLEGKFLLAVGRTEWEALRWDASAADKKHIINEADFVFSASVSPEALTIGRTKLAEQSVNDLLLDCSDAHHLSTSSDKDRIGNCFTWIKADSSFEGLKQILYERSRLRIASSPHVPPAKRVRAVNLSFPAGSTIFREENKGNPSKHSTFCLNGDRTVSFSPYFTCVIGGRGSGKSTLLNLIAHKAGASSNFFERNKIRTPAGSTSIEDFVEINGSTDIEFISQNEIEGFAESGELTDAIYERLAGLTDAGSFSQAESLLEFSLRDINKQIDLIKEIQSVEASAVQIKSKLNEAEAITSSLSSKEYTDLVAKIEKNSQEVAGLEASKSRYITFVVELTELARKHPAVGDAKNAYDTALNSLASELSDLLGKSIDFSQVERELVTNKTQLDEAKTDLTDYLNAHGVSEQNQADFQHASEQLPILRSRLERHEEKKASVQAEIDSLLALGTPERTADASFRAEIVAAFQPLNEKLRSITTNANVKEIRFEFEFDQARAREGIFEDFYSEFERLRPDDLGTQRNSVRDNLFSTRPEDLGEIEEYLQELENRDDSNSKKFVQTVFSDSKNFDIYKLIVRSHLSNSFYYKRIVGYYGDRELRSCSFGQRCTAVIVALIMFGNKPLIIDEPEAHLDSKLIAEYLVGLIKERKLERQLIFATHNANFVINGDAELINILEVDDGHLTNITATTIENLATRETLLNLEGGKAAFEQRDRRLIRN
ncbi:MAG TPA: hypothetical protein DEP46_19795, partial [Blastocatellia bacterium]|nr:hypothetical protein [Blastocatellia bacterium]